MSSPPSTFHLPPSLSDLKVALVCDWLTGIGGAERVVLELHNMFPAAPIYTSQYDPEALPWFKDTDVRTSRLQNLSKTTKKFLPVLRARSFSRLDLSAYDLVISSSGAEAKGIKTGKNTLHVNYCHAPTHYYWSRYDDYLQAPGFGRLDPLARMGLKTLVESMRRWDYKAAQGPDVMIANSTYTQAKIKQYYKRDATVIHPPVDIERFHLTPSTSRLPARKGFVITGRQTPYKRIDLAVAACSQLGLPLTVIGNGPEHQKLRRLAGPSVTFRTDVDDKQLPGLLRQAAGFIFPGIDDFGISAVEALAAGTPVIAYHGGGALDYVIAAKTGLFFEQQAVDSLVDALTHFKPEAFEPKTLAHHASQFSPAVFRSRIIECTTKYVKERAT